jgi:hypothetical protein
VRKNAKPNDLIIDFDDIRQVVGGKRYDDNEDTLRKAYRYRAKLLHSLSLRDEAEAWLVVMAPSQAERQAWVKALGKVQLHVIATPIEECKRRVANDPARDGYRDRLYQAIDRYFAKNS